MVLPSAGYKVTGTVVQQCDAVSEFISRVQDQVSAMQLKIQYPASNAMSFLRV
jgi:hypothetical protein